MRSRAKWLHLHFSSHARPLRPTTIFWSPHPQNKFSPLQHASHNSTWATKHGSVDAEPANGRVSEFATPVADSVLQSWNAITAEGSLNGMQGDDADPLARDRILAEDPLEMEEAKETHPTPAKYTRLQKRSVGSGRSSYSAGKRRSSQDENRRKRSRKINKDLRIYNTRSITVKRVQEMRSSVRTSIRHKFRKYLWKEAAGTDSDHTYIQLYSKRGKSQMNRISASARLETYYPYWSVAFSWFHHLDHIDYLLRPQWRFEYESYVRRRFRQRFVKHPNMSPLKLWKELSPRLQARFWMSAILYSLAHKPSAVLKLIQDIRKRSPSLIPSYISRDCTQFVFSYYSPKGHGRLEDLEVRHQAPWKNGFFFAAARAHHAFSWKQNGWSAHFSNTSTNLLVQHLDLRYLRQLQPILASNRSSSGQAQLIWSYAYRLAMDGNFEEAFGYLKRLPPHQLEKPETYYLCMRILTYNFPSEDIYRLRTRIFLLIMDLQLKSLGPIRSIMLDNAVSAGDSRTAWDTHQVMKENGVPPDAYSYSILLKTINLGAGMDAIEQIYQEAEANNILHNSPFLAGALVRAVFTCMKLNGDDPPFRTMLRLYAKLFDATPLKDIGIWSEVTHSSPIGRPLMRPTDHVLSFMMIAWLAENYQSEKMDRRFRLYLHHLRERKSRIAITGNSTYVLRAFIHAYGKRGQSLDTCSSIVHGMENPETWLSDPAKRLSEPVVSIRQLESDVSRSLGRKFSLSRGSKHETSSRELPNMQHEPDKFHVCIPRPDEPVWSVLLLAYARGGFHSGAEMIMSILEKKGYEPTPFTWNNLIHSYSVSQSTEGIALAVQRMSEAGHGPDDRTMSRLSRLRDRNELKAAFDRMDHERNASK